MIDDPRAYDQPPQDIYDNRMPMQLDQQSEGALIYQLDTEEIIAMIEHSLRGEVNKDGNWVKVPNQVTVNDKGCAAIISELRARFSRNTFLSNLDDDTIERICVTLHMNLLKMMALNYMEWEMEKGDIPATLYRIMDIVEIGLRRGGNKTTLNYFKPQLRIAETQQMMPQRRKIMGLF